MSQHRESVDEQVPTIAAMSVAATEVEIRTVQVHDETMSERPTRDVMEGVEHGSSRPPSPPETRSPTPRVSIAPCPSRLTPLVPPVNYGAVEKRTIFRSGFPQDRNVEFLERLRLNGTISLVEEEMKPEVAKFIDVYSINHVCVPIKANKDGEVRTTLNSLCEAILYLMNPINHPVYVHCNRGKHRTGCVIACLRKCQMWPIDEILAEYDTYAGEKARPEDKNLIRAFNPVDVYKYAENEKMLESWPAIMRKDSVLGGNPADVFDLASFLPAHDTALIPVESSEDDSSDSDDGLQIAQRVIRANREVYQMEQEPAVADIDLVEKESSQQEDVILVEEVDEIDPYVADENVEDTEWSPPYDWNNDTPNTVAYASTTTQPLAVSPVRARAAA
ncbi:hypothetical protein M409DRAFT_54633 [Zasmidium cellare ATCC 36951]|uniref:diphosphoinositol-polyphosphate diphosphatase n=1 Tax=Zasmidium cellare ATCC 36951 TaxID=1080233 RepID=A0A6A6CN30_ZASCE|nr:uncharacterized protein M409DRAFT_54633 [Zasmidium cellare ATCC 36951]KAF2166856.1 hypothetical protein M409DRAFT_54633 [Zasmidium cellare ATCC 36951]